mgnify:CR=1 FL=1
MGHSRCRNPELLRHFWRHHNSRAKPIFRQYASAIFCVEKAQLDVAKKGREAWQAQGEEESLTAILPAREFFPAADNHQKYYLQQDSGKMLLRECVQCGGLSAGLVSLNAKLFCSGECAWSFEVEKNRCTTRQRRSYCR